MAMKTRWLLNHGVGIFGACLLAGLTVFSAPIYAAQCFTSDPANTTVGGTACFTVSADTVSVTLTNTQADIQSLAQTLSDISFSVSGGTTVGAVSQSGNLITFTDGSSTQAHSSGSGNLWTLSGGSGSYLLTGLVGNDKTLIIGPITSPTTYCTPTKCPDGIGNPLFNPYFDQSATFTLAIAGVSSTSIISDVVFSFGTTPETLVGVPIPAAVWLFGSGLIGLIGIARRRHAIVTAPTLTA
jgi:hypothetical protein